MKKPLVPLLCVLAAVGIAYAVHLVFYGTPLEYSFNEAGKLNGSSLFFNYKIFYFHVAHAFCLFAAVFVSGVASIGYLKYRKDVWDDVARAANDVAVPFGAVVLLSGSIWAKAAWDKWWQWEPRLTMSLLLWLVLVGYVLVRKFAGAGSERIAAGMSIFGMVGVPFIYTMVGQDSHPASGANGVLLNLGTRLLPAALASIATFFFWYIALVVARVQSTRDERELRELREQALDLGVLE